MKLLSTYINHQMDILKYDHVKLSKSGPTFSHLYFADDLTLMS